MIRADEGEDVLPPAALLDALLVYAEPLAENAHVLVLGDAASPIAERLLSLGARGVQLFDPDPARAANAARSASVGVIVRPLLGDLDVREGSFDLAIVPDLSELDDPRRTVARLARAVGKDGAVLALGRAQVEGVDDPPFPTELGPAALAYDELYEAFASSFEDVTLAGVVPFAGVVFAELGGEEAPAVSVDTRYATGEAPSVFVVVASASRGQRPALEPYAIVQLPPGEAPASDAVLALESAFAAAQHKADIASSQLQEARERLVVADVQRVETAARLDRAGLERDAALTRAMELEAVLAASQQTLAMLEQRLLVAEQTALLHEQAAFQREDEDLAREQATLLRDQAAFARARDAFGHEASFGAASRMPTSRLAEEAPSSRLEGDADDEPGSMTGEELAALVARAEESEAALAAARAEAEARRAELAQAVELHAAETAAYEAQLQDRARVVAGLEKELARREELVRELVTRLEAVESSRAAYEAPPPVSITPPVSSAVDATAETTSIEVDGAAREIGALRSRLDALAAEVARREGELTARAWRIEELEAELRARPPVRPSFAADDPRSALAQAHDELDALRQALTQEHAARRAAESGEALAAARAELARQATLLDQVRRAQTS